MKSKFLRCVICDYTNTDGSELRDVAPTYDNNVKFSKRFNGYYCWHCFSAMQTAADELKAGDDEERTQD